MAELRLLDILTELEYKEYLKFCCITHDTHNSKIELESVIVIVPHHSNLKPRWFWLDGTQVERKLVYSV